jgi:hypothetical protein
VAFNQKEETVDDRLSHRIIHILSFLPAKGHRLSRRFQYHVILPSKADYVELKKLKASPDTKVILTL